MRTSGAWFIAIFIACLLWLSTALASNLVLNPGFESGLTPWKKYGGSVGVVSAPVHGGSHAVRQAYNGSSTAAKYLYQSIVVTGGTSYNESAYVVSAGHVAIAYLRAAWYVASDCSGSQMSTADSPQVSPGDSYAKVRAQFTAPAGAHCLRLRLVMKPDGGNPAVVYWDDVSLEAVSAATPTVTATGTSTSTPTLIPSPTLTPLPTVCPGGVALNEYLPRPQSDWNGDGTINTNDEYIELYNGSSVTVDLAGWQLDDIAGGGSSLYTIGSVPLAPGGFVLFYHAQTRIGLNDTGDSVRLLCPNGSIVDETSYSRPAYDQAYSRSVDGGGVWRNDYPPSPGRSNRLATATPTPTVAPTFTPTWTVTPTFTPLPTVCPGGVALNEYLPRPHSDWNGDGTINTNDEYIELYNGGGATVDLAGWQLDDIAGGGSSPYTIGSVPLAPGGFVLFYHAQTRIGLNDTGDSVRLLCPNGSIVDETSYSRPAYDQAYSRSVDGGGVWRNDYPPSPGRSNRPATVTPTPTLTFTPAPTPTPTPTPLPDYRFWGYAYRGLLGDLGTPLANLTVVLYGQNTGGRRVLLQQHVSHADGWFGFYTDRLFDDYIMHAEAPAGLSLQGAWAPSPATVVANEIIYWRPQRGYHQRNFFFAAAPGTAPRPGSAHSLLIQEVQYDPPQKGWIEKRYEWAAIYNPLTVSQSLSGWTLADDSGQGDYLPDMTLPPGHFLVLAADVAAFRENFPQFDGDVRPLRHGKIGNGLGNSGDALLLANPQSIVVDAVSWGRDDSQLSPAVLDAPAGYSIERLPPARDRDLAADWVWQPDPQPGRAGALPTPTSTNTPTPTSSPTCTPTPTRTPSPTRTASPTTTPTTTATLTPTVSPSATATVRPSPTWTMTPIATHTPTSTSNVTLTLTLTPTVMHTLSPPHTPTPTSSPTPAQTAMPTPMQTATLSPTPTVPAWAGQVRINEFLPAPKRLDWDGDGVGNSYDEWIELYNGNDFAVDLAGFWLDDLANGGSHPYHIVKTTILAAYGYTVFYRRQTKIALNNNGDWVRLLAPGGQVVDAVSYHRSPGYDRSYSWWHGRWQVGHPTPGEANFVPPPDPYYRISLSDALRWPAGRKVVLEGIITVPPGALGKHLFYVGDGAVGLAVYQGSGKFYPWQPGDRVHLYGRLRDYRHQRQIFLSGSTDVAIVIHGKPLPPYSLTSAADFARQPDARLVSLQGQVVRKKGRKVWLAVRDGVVTVYARSGLGISLRSVIAGSWWQAAGIVCRIRKTRVVALRSPADLTPWVLTRVVSERPAPTRWSQQERLRWATDRACPARPPARHRDCAY